MKTRHTTARRIRPSASRSLLRATDGDAHLRRQREVALELLDRRFVPGDRERCEAATLARALEDEPGLRRLQLLGMGRMPERGTGPNDDVVHFPFDALRVGESAARH